MKKIIAIIAISQLISSCAPIVLGAAATGGVVAAQDRTVGKAVDDTSIKLQITSAFLQKDFENLFRSVSVEVNEGRVLLTGSVETPEYKAEATRISWQPDGVREVINELQISASGDFKDYAKDSWITTQIKSKLLLDKSIKSINYNIDTVAGTVYLSGIATSQEEMNKMLQIVRSTKFVQNVVNHVRLKNSPIRQKELDN